MKRKYNYPLFLILIAILIMLAIGDLSAETNVNLKDKTFDEQLKILQDTITYSSNNQLIVECATKYFELTKNDKNKYNKAQGIYNLAVSKWLIADYNNSITYFYKGMELAQEIKDTLIQINASIYLGLIYGRIYDWEMVEKYYDNAYKLSHKFNDYYFIASSCWNMASLSNNIGKFDESLQFSNEALYYLDKVKYKTDYDKHFAYGLVYYYLAQTYCLTKNQDSAIGYFLKSISENTIISNSNILAPAYNQISESYCFDKQYDNAIKYAQKALELSNSANNITYTLNAFLSLSNAFYGKKMLDSAYSYLSLYSRYLDTANKKDTRVLSAKLEASNQQKLLQKEIELNNQQFNYSIIISCIIVFALIIVSFLFYSRYKIKNTANIQLASLNSTKDKFFTIISHDLKTPVSSFNNLSQLLATYYQDFSEDEKIKHINSLKNSSDNILKLLENLLTWSRIQTGNISINPEPLGLHSVVNTEIQNQKLFAEKKNIVISSSVDENVSVFADEEMVSMVIRNLLSNAIKYTSENGSVSISSRNCGEQTEIDIMDSGVGIKDEDKEKLFVVDIKHSTIGTSNEKGTGLGLNLCKEFIERNNGRIWFESEVNKGTKFTFSLPNAE